MSRKANKSHSLNAIMKHQAWKTKPQNRSEFKQIRKSRKSSDDFEFFKRKTFLIQAMAIKNPKND